MPDILMLDEPYEIEDFITGEELLDSKAFIINKNFTTKHEAEPLKVMTMESNLEFIELCIREIPRILMDRFALNCLIDGDLK